MEGEEKIKRILDSVHGYIQIPNSLFENFIDTPYFQRLRRIEQTSGRSIYPSARHDRFIHSLGVYHIGSLIVRHLKTDRKCYTEDALDKSVFSSYVLACLLHDVCHTPFSHTFEEDYTKAKLLEALINETIDDDFEKDSKNVFNKIAPHEIMSAHMVWKVFKEKIESNGANPHLIVRMICGVPYELAGRNDKEKLEFSFQNCMIELIHGGIIDADGLDYVCRDAWASGYDTNNIDVDRLISSIGLQKNEKGEYEVCYSAKALNAIESVLGVKTFQQYNVINHHKVVYEQELLKRAVYQAAYYHCSEKGIEDLSDDEKVSIKNFFFDFKTFFEPKTLLRTRCTLYRPMDDDFVHMMKYISADGYVNEWISRSYKLKPLWKSKAEFFEVFDFLQDKNYTDKMWLFSDRCKQSLSEEFKILTEDVWILPADGKEKRVKTSQIKLWVNGKICHYEDLFQDYKHKFANGERPFFFVYIPKNLDTTQVLEFLKEETQTKVF